MESKKITDFYPLDFLQWIEIPNDDKNAEVIFQMFPEKISRQDASSFWEFRQRAFDELKHHTFTDMIRAAASFSKNEADIIKQASSRNVDLSEAQIAYKELQDRYVKIILWHSEALEEKAEQERIREKEREVLRIQKQKALDEKFKNDMKAISRSSQKTQDKNSEKRGQINHQIMQKEEELDALSRLNNQFEETAGQALGATHSLLGNAEALMSRSAQHDKTQISHEQSVFLEIQHSLLSYSNRQNVTFEEIGRQTKNNREEQLENLYQERKQLEW